MKIAIIYSHLITEGGAARVALSLARSLQKNNHQATVFCFSYNEKIFPEICRDLDIRVVSPRRPFSSVSGAITLFGKLKQKWQRNRLYAETAKKIADRMDFDFDALNCQDDYSYKVGFFYKKKNPKAKIIWTVYNLPFLYQSKGNWFRDIIGSTLSFLEKLYETRFFSCVDTAITLDFGNQALVERIGLPAKAIHGGVDFDNFYAPLKNRKFSPSSFQLLSVGSVCSYRRFEDTILAVAVLRNNGYNARGLIIAQEDENSLPYLNKLREIIKKSKMEKYVDFHLGMVPEEEFKKAYQQSDFFIFPNHIRIWGLAAFEAMASGLPLIVSRVTSVAEVLRDGENALFVDPMKPDDIAAKVLTLVNDLKKYYCLAEAGQKFVKENIAWDSYALKFLEVAK